MILDVSGKQLSFDYLSATLHIRNGWRGWPSERRKWHRIAVADLGDTEGFGREEKKDRLYAFQLSEWVYKRKEVTLEGAGSQTFGELSDIDTLHAVPKQSHTLAFTGSKWIAFADPLQQTGWLIDIKIISPHVVTGKEHKVRKVVNSGTRLCSYILETKIIVIEEARDKLSNILKTNNSRQGTLKMVSEFSPAGIIDLGLASSTILLEIFLEDRPDDFVYVLPGFKLKWPQKHVNEKTGVRILVNGIPEVNLTLESI